MRNLGKYVKQDVKLKIGTVADKYVLARGGGGVALQSAELGQTPW